LKRLSHVVRGTSIEVIDPTTDFILFLNTSMRATI
jgi:hypothetical protein